MINNKVPVQFPAPADARKEIVEEFKKNLLTILSKGVYTEPKFLKPAEAAAHLNLSRTTIYKMINDGTLKSHKVGGSRLIAKTSIDQLFSSNV